MPLFPDAPSTQRQIARTRARADRHSGAIAHRFRRIAIAVCCVALSSGCQNPSPSTVAPAVPSPSQPPPSPLPPLLATALIPSAAELKPAIATFIEGTAASSTLANAQGVWLQDDRGLLADYQGTVPLSAASLTKAATSLAALQTLGAGYRYETQVGFTGAVQNGLLKGDLIVRGGQNPFFVWEDAIALGNFLTRQGIRQIDGNLVIQGPFYMNFETQTAAVGAALRQGLDANLWPQEALQQYQTLPATTPKPQVTIKGGIVAVESAPAQTQWMLQHRSLPLASLLKKMNRYSNNPMADTIANSIGGPKIVAQQAIAATGVGPSEIQLVNGSGLAVENRMSPRAVCGIFRAIDRLVQAQGMTVADIFTVMGQDESVLDQRPLPVQSVLKSGTLDTVSALAGALPTRQGVVWFALMNNEGDVEAFRKQQETLLSALDRTLGPSKLPLPALKSTIPEPPASVFEQLWVKL
ncbi:D-alanyl-D-alanine carboxypeptidase [Altericista sp. CCNU0014]|uniref:D-alanyl-D-alanine carboxypeptidase n=1 Tax=Altericista sp. CCNU0014 TaxID=3082949 RepID=UPI00384D7507